MGESTTRGVMMRMYESPELLELGLLSMDTLAATTSKGGPANPNGDENAPEDE